MDIVAVVDCVGLHKEQVPATFTSYKNTPPPLPMVVATDQ